MTNTTYCLPDGFTVTARGEADSDWNGWPVPILSADEYLRLGAHLDAIAEEHGVDEYVAQYVEDGKVTSGYYCDGIAWERGCEHTDDRVSASGVRRCVDCGAVYDRTRRDWTASTR